jgi:type I restriction enzyme, S subunit
MPDAPPVGWVKTTLGELCLPITTIVPNDSPDVDFTYFDIGSIDNRTNRIVDDKVIAGRNAPSRARQVVQKDDILFSTVRTYLRKIARVERTYPNPVASTGFAVIRLAEGISSQFIFFQILSDGFLHSVNALQTGSSYPAVRAKDVFSQPILLPPVREQERIAARLGAAVAALQRADAATGRAKERIERYRAAVLDSAFTGELTRKWRSGNKPSAAASKPLEELLAIRRS